MIGLSSSHSSLDSLKTALRPGDGKAAAFGRRCTRRPILLLLLLLPISLTTWALMDPFAAMAYMPESLSQKWSSYESSNSPPPQRPSLLDHDPTSNQGNQTRVLIVSAYYPLRKSKHSWLDYHTWLSHFLSNVESDVYFFAPTEMGDALLQLRGSLPFHLNATYEWVDEITPLKGLANELAVQYEIDPEKSLHKSELYLLWAAKPFFVREAIQNLRLGGKEYDFVLWMDAGSMREEHAYKSWPNTELLQNLWNDGERLTGTDRNDLILFPLEKNLPPQFASYHEADGPLDVYEATRHDFSEGSLFGGSPRALEWFSDIYFAYMDHWLAAGFFVGKDQSIMNSLFVLYPERFITIWNRDPRSTTSIHRKYGGHGYCGKAWFYYFFALATTEEQEAMNEIWQGQWRFDFWNGPREHCTTTGVASIMDVLKLAFGDSWTPPPRTLEISHVS